MSEVPKRRPLKEKVIISRTVQIQRFEPASITVSKEYYSDVETMESVIRELTERVNRWFGSA